MSGRRFPATVAQHRVAAAKLRQIRDLAFEINKALGAEGQRQGIDFGGIKASDIDAVIKIVRLVEKVQSVLDKRFREDGRGAETGWDYYTGPDYP